MSDQPIPETQLFAQVGEEGFTRLVAAFYAQVPDDPILGPMYPSHDLAGAETRLLDFLLFRFGGVSRYLETRGHPRLRMRHAPFKIDEAARNQWMIIMTRAMDETSVPEPSRSTLLAFFADTATFMRNA